MATALMIRGELEHDIGLLRAEVRRIVSVSRDLKGRRKKLTEDAEKDEKAFISDYQNLTNRALSPSDFNSRTKGRLTYVERELRSFVIEDTVFEKELEKAKAILEQFKSLNSCVFAYKGLCQYSPFL